MKKVQSADGTTIAFDQLGKGPAVILVGGMFEQQAMDSETAQLAALPSGLFIRFIGVIEVADALGLSCPRRFARFFQ